VKAFLAAAVLVLTGCGSVGHVAPGPVPSAAATAGAGQVGDADENRVLQYHVGDTFEVALHQQSGWSQWSNLAAMDRSVLQPIVDTHAAAARGVTLAGFRAARPGTTDITASASPACSPGMACAAIARLWRVTVQVT
jgi:hypothetical protein